MISLIVESIDDDILVSYTDRVRPEAMIWILKRATY